MDGAALRAVRGKTRVLLTRFLARALLCPIYSQDWLDSRPKGDLPQHSAGLQASAWEWKGQEFQRPLSDASCWFLASHERWWSALHRLSTRHHRGRESVLMPVQRERACQS